MPPGRDFGNVIAKYSEAPDATSGGDMGWVTHYQFSPDLEAAIFQTPIGGISRSHQRQFGYFICPRSSAEETRTADAAQQAKLSKTVFDNWLTELTNATNVWTDQAGLTSLTPASPTP